MTWYVPDDDLSVMEFGFGAQTSGWVGMGFNKMPIMAGADIIIAELSGSSVVVSNHHALGTYMPDIGALRVHIIQLFIPQNSILYSPCHSSPHLLAVDSPDVPNVHAIHNVSGSYVRGWLGATFRRTRVTGSPLDFDLGATCPSYYMLFAMGGPGFSQHGLPGTAAGP